MTTEFMTRVDVFSQTNYSMKLDHRSHIFQNLNGAKGIYSLSQLPILRYVCDISMRLREVFSTHCFPKLITSIP